MRANPYLEVIIAAVIWGSSGLFVKYFDLPAPVIAFFRLAIPSIVLGIIFLAKRTKIYHSKLLLWASSLNAVRMFFYFLALSFTSLSKAVIVLYTWPLFANLWSFIFLKERLSRRNVFLLFTAFAGIILIYLKNELSFSDQDFIGMTSMLLSSIVYSSTVILFKKESLKCSQTCLLFYQNIIGAIIFLPFIFLSDYSLDLEKGSILVFYALLIGLVAFGLFFSALKEIKASVASFLAFFEVPSAIFFGIVFFGDVMTWNVIIGGALIITSAIFARKH